MFLARDQARVESCDHDIYHHRSQDNECSDPRHMPIKLIIDGALLTPVRALLTCAHNCCKERKKPGIMENIGMSPRVSLACPMQSSGADSLKKVTFKQCLGSPFCPLRLILMSCFSNGHVEGQNIAVFAARHPVRDTVRREIPFQFAQRSESRSK